MNFVAWATPCHATVADMARLPYLDKKDLIRSALVKRARERAHILTYTELGRIVDIPARGPWKRILDFIAVEEKRQGLPDITFLVVNKRTGYPGQIGFKRADPPTPEQKALAGKELQKVIDHYCHGAKNAFRGSGF
jgi:hypothetical protein